MIQSWAATALVWGSLEHLGTSLQEEPPKTACDDLDLSA